MSILLPDKDNPFASKTPFDILGIDRSADAKKLRQALQEKIEDARMDTHDDDARLRKQEEIKWAYDQLRNPRSRVVLEVFSFDPRAGDQECRRRAEQLRKVDFDYNRVFKGYHELLPCNPEVDASRLQKHDPVLNKSLALRSSETQGALSPREEYQAAIRFET